MRKFGLSAAVVCVLAAPAWASYPVPYAPDGPPPPAGYAPAMYPPVAPAGYGYGVAPDMLPPLMPPMGTPGMPPTVAPPGMPPTVPPGIDPAADPCGYAFDPCYPHQRKRQSIVHNEYWVRGDWLYWDLRDTPIPSSLIVGGNPAVPQAGIPGGGNSIPLVGGPRDVGRYNGARITLGQWFDPDGELGIEFSGFLLGREGSADFFNGSNGRSVSVPVRGTNGTVGVYDFSFPGRFNGSVGVTTATQLFGGDASFLHRVYGNGCISVDTLFGYRYVQLYERLSLFGRQQSVGSTGTFAGAALPAGSVVTTFDSFRTRTEFHGAQIGARVEARRDMLTVTGFGKVGLGANIQNLSVAGVSRSGTRSVAGGLRGLPTNFLGDSDTDFSFLTETGIELGLQVTKNVSLRVGYNVLFWSDVLRPGNTIDPILSRTQVPIDPTFNALAPATRPVQVFRTSDFLAHGLIVGVMVDW